MFANILLTTLSPMRSDGSQLWSTAFLLDKDSMARHPPTGKKLSFFATEQDCAYDCQETPECKFFAHQPELSMHLGDCLLLLPHQGSVRWLRTTKVYQLHRGRGAIAAEEVTHTTRWPAGALLGYFKYPEGCAAECEVTPECTFFAHNGDACWAQSREMTSARYPAGVKFYRIKSDIPEDLLGEVESRNSGARDINKAEHVTKEEFAWTIVQCNAPTLAHLSVARSLRICSLGSTECVQSTTILPIMTLKHSNTLQLLLRANMDAVKKLWDGPDYLLQRLTYTCAPKEGSLYDACGNENGLRIDEDTCTWNHSSVVVQLLIPASGEAIPAQEVTHTARWPSGALLGYFKYPEGCAAECEVTPECTFFAYNGDACWTQFRDEMIRTTYPAGFKFYRINGISKDPSYALPFSSEISSVHEKRERLPSEYMPPLSPQFVDTISGSPSVQDTLDKSESVTKPPRVDNDAKWWRIVAGSVGGVGAFIVLCSVGYCYLVSERERQKSPDSPV